MASLLQQGHCLSDVRISESTMPGAGNGLFARRDFEEGEIVTISPVLTLPSDTVALSASNSALMNYCYGRIDSNVILMPLGYGPMINHNSMERPNLNLSWFHLEPEESPVFHMNVNELFDASYAPLDIAFVAVRPIATGEEFFVDYGNKWSLCFTAMQDEIVDAKRGYVKNECSSKFGHMRYFLASADHLYPPSWINRDTVQ